MLSAGPLARQFPPSLPAGTAETDVSPFATVAIKAKVETSGQYQEYLDELKPLREEFGIELKEDLYPEEKK